MPRDNFETSPEIVPIRRAGNVRQLNMELALSETQTISNTGAASGAGAGGAVGTNLTREIVTGGGQRYKFGPDAGE